MKSLYLKRLNTHRASILSLLTQESQYFQGNCVSSHGKQAVKLPHSRPDGEDFDDITSAMGVVQALISVFLDDNDKLRCINAGRTRITFLLRPPLYYVCVSSWGEPESVVRTFVHHLLTFNFLL